MEEKKIMPLSEIAAALMSETITHVAEETGISRPTLYNIMSRKIDPRYSTLEKLSEYLSK